MAKLCRSVQGCLCQGGAVTVPHGSERLASVNCHKVLHGGEAAERVEPLMEKNLEGADTHELPAI